MKKFVMVAFIAASVVFGFTACSSDDGGSNSSNEKAIVGKWQVTKTITLDKEGKTVILEEIEMYDECEKNDHFDFKVDKTLVDYYSELYQDECHKYEDKGSWKVVGSTLSITTNYEDEVNTSVLEVKTLNATELVLEAKLKAEVGNTDPIYGQDRIERIYFKKFK